MQESIDKLTEAFKASARRWEMIVYPSVFAFIILAAYGFYLVYSLAKDVHYLAISVDSHMTVLAANMQNVSENVGTMSQSIVQMETDLESIDDQMGALNGIERHISVIDDSINGMSFSVYQMQQATNQLSRDVHKVQRPISAMTRWMPW